MEGARRDALLRAMLVELGEKGYGEVSVERALRTADVSAAEFEAEFGGKDECLFAAYDDLMGQVLAHTTAGCDAESAWPERVRDGLTALLALAAAEPEMAKVVTRAFPGIRPATYQRYVDLLGSFLPYMEEGREYSEVEDELPGEVELLAVGAAEAIIFGEVDAGRAERLPKMMPEILFSVLVPFIGPDRAADEMRNAATAL
jgi:AcrR family transcriptional regulator